MQANKHSLDLVVKVIEIRRATARPVGFTGKVEHMDHYVNHFVQEVQRDFPLVIFKRVQSIDNLAYTNKGPWNGNLDNFTPKEAGSITFNKFRVDDMTTAHQLYSTSAPRSPQKKKYFNRWQEFLFMFACTTLHEMAHLFICYLSLTNQLDTPPKVTHLDYGGVIDDDGIWQQGGDSGRWLENMLYGGSIEFYRNTREGDQQCGMAYILDRHDIARRLDPDIIAQIVEGRPYTFPFRCIGPGLSSQDRRRAGLRSMGSTVSGNPIPPNARTMRALDLMRKFPLYNIRIDELRQRPADPRLPLRVERAR
ncbi:hypothetical protein B7463_g96, partial [Scytalidium lignicola]